MSGRITIRQAGGAPEPKHWEEDSPVAPPSVPTPPKLFVSEAEKRAMRELEDEDRPWNHLIGGGYTSRDRFVQKWIAKHSDE